MSNDARYEEILRRIQQRKAEEARKPKQDVLAGVLDGLNVLDALEAIKKRSPAGLSAYGPRVIAPVQTIQLSPLTTEPESNENRPQWLGAVIWYKPKGYARYETLGLLGVWAVQESEAITVTVGSKRLAFTAPVFNPESYYHHLKRGFKVLYDGDVSPPQPDDATSGTVLLIKPYTLDQRLALRQDIEAALRDWRASKPTLD